MTTEALFNLAQTFGLAGLILLALGIATWRASTWCAREVILPIRGALLGAIGGFITHLEQCLGRLEQAQQEQGRALGRQMEAIERWEAIMARLLQAREEGK